MERFEYYCKDIVDINGIKTYIVSQEYLDNILLDLEFLASLCGSLPLIEGRRIVRYLVDEAQSNPSRIFFAFVKHINSSKTYERWEPINCYKNGDDYYHIYIRDNWMCRECKQINYGKFIMPMIEHDAVFYSGTDNKFPTISSLFKSKKCAYCEKTLQNHFI